MIMFRTLGTYQLIAVLVNLHTILITDAQPELKLVNVVFRHGDRTPDKKVEMYPNDPYLNYSFYPEDLGQLTIRGKQREYGLGKVLRDRYENFLGDMYLPKLVVGHSSDYDRTKMSLQLILAALFPPLNNRQQWHPDLKWQPIPTTYTNRVDDNFFLSDECPLYLDEYDRVLDLPETKEKMAPFQDMVKNLTQLTGKKMDKPQDWYYLYHTFIAETAFNLTLPEWAYKYYPDGLLFNATITAYNISNSTPLLRRLFAGPIIQAMLNNMKAAQTSSDTKIYLYSGHETNIATLLHAFKVNEPYVPAFTSAIILELFEQDKQYYVQFLHYRGIPSVIDVLQISGCEVLCPFNDFVKLTQDLIPSDKEMICDKRKTESFADRKYPAELQDMMYTLIKSNS